MRIAYYVYIYCRCRMIRITKISRIIQMDVLIRHISQEISQYVLIPIYNKHTQLTLSFYDDNVVCTNGHVTVTWILVFELSS